MVPTYVVLGGYGQMGKVAGRDLSATAKNSLIIIAGRHGKLAKQYAAFLSKTPECRKNKNIVKGVKVDASNVNQLAKILDGTHVCLNCAQYTFNIPAMKACLKAKTHYLDLGGLFHDTKKQLKLHNIFKRNGLTAILGCGSTPGITNVLAGYGSTLLDRVFEIHVRFAGYDETKYDTHFVLPYSIETLFDEFTAKPAIFTKGKLIFVKPMSGQGKEIFPKPFGEVSTFYTLHSELATFPSSFKNKGLRECSFKVGFPKDFVHDVSVLIGLGLHKRLDIARQIIKPPSEKIRIHDYEDIRVIMKGTKNKKPVALTLDCIAKFNPKWNFAAGDMDTGTPISIMAQMIIENTITMKGVFAPELLVKPLPFFKELEKRGMEIKKHLSYQ